MNQPTETPTTAPTPPSALALRVSPAAGAVFVPFLAIMLLSCIWLMVRGPIDFVPVKVTQDMLLHGDLTHHFAKELADAPLAKEVANLERGGSWLLVGDLGPRVREGCQGWLFLTDETRINRHAEDNAKVKAQAVIELRQRLAQKGIQLLVAVVPDKSRIAAAKLCPLVRPALLAPRVEHWLALLHAAGVPALDLNASLQPLGDQAFLRTDTHWSEAGAQAAAAQIAKGVNALPFTPTPQQVFDLEQAPSARRPGDLVRLAGIDWLPLYLQPPAEMVAATTVKARAAETAASSDSADDLFGDSNLPNTALIGTSFSRNSNFAGFLEHALGAPLGNFAKDGGEFSGAAQAYFASPAFQQTPPKLIVWEIPERDLQTPYVPIEAKF